MWRLYSKSGHNHWSFTDVADTVVKWVYILNIVEPVAEIILPVTLFSSLSLIVFVVLVKGKLIVPKYCSFTPAASLFS